MSGTGLFVGVVLMASHVEDLTDVDQKTTDTEEMTHSDKKKVLEANLIVYADLLKFEMNEMERLRGKIDKTLLTDEWFHEYAKEESSKNHKVRVGLIIHWSNELNEKCELALNRTALPERSKTINTMKELCDRCIQKYDTEHKTFDDETKQLIEIKIYEDNKKRKKLYLPNIHQWHHMNRQHAETRSHIPSVQSRREPNKSG